MCLYRNFFFHRARSYEHSWEFPQLLVRRKEEALKMLSPNSYSTKSRNQLNRSGDTLKSSKPTIRCTKTRPCKCIKNCEICRKIRREYFIQTWAVFGKQWRLDTHVMITWKQSPDNHSWNILLNAIQRFSKFGSGRRFGKYVRVISVSEDGAPHVHILTNKKTSIDILRLVKSKWKLNNNSVKVDPEYDIEGLLGYFFDQNFLFSFCDPERPKRIRLLSGSRPASCGFPSHENKARMQRIFNNLYDQLPVHEECFKKALKWNDVKNELSNEQA